MSSLGIIALTHAVAISPDVPGQSLIETAPDSSRADAAIALAGSRAGAIGVINLELARLDDKIVADKAAAAVSNLIESAGQGGCGIRCDITQLDPLKPALKKLSTYGGTATVVISLAGKTDRKQLKQAIELVHANKLEAFVEAVSLEEATDAQASGADAVIAKGQEAAGRIGEATTFVLLQQCVRALKLPVWAEGGIGLHTAAACYAAGAKGVVLNSQLFLTAEANLPLPIKQKIATMDGTETTTVNVTPQGSYRLYHRHASGQHESEDDAAIIFGAGKANENTLAGLRTNHAKLLTAKPLDRLYFFGQDIAFAADLTKRFSTVSGIVQAIRHAAVEHASQAIALKPLGEGASLAQSHGTRFPLIQGAMTRVSDTAPFAFKVAEGGALPFLALALMRQAEVETLLAETQKQLGSLPWGVGILGFVPQQLRQEQLEAISKYKPPFALIAGGRPDQAKTLDAMGIKTYLHVPSPLLLESFIEMGSRRFIFEGRECGGHVGPRSSFVLWEAMIEKLLAAIGPKDDASQYHVVFAGGVHDGLSAAMVSAMAAPLSARGVRVGGLMGTAYLFTNEAVETGAIVKQFQEAALSCKHTVLLETGPGHAIRCIDSPYKQTFDEKRQELVLQKRSKEEVREELELMNLGRLRIASKGLNRKTSAAGTTSGAARAEAIAELTNNGLKKENLTTIPDDAQWSQGMYMIGQVAAMHDKLCTIEQLHDEVSNGCTAWLDKVAVEKANVEYVREPGRQPSEPIAVVGMSCLFPKAGDVETYWQNILNKVDTITEVPIEHWDWRNFYDKDPLARDKIYSKWGGFLEDIKFDATKYGIPPSSLSSIDPMQLLLLEVTRKALDDAGYTERTFENQRTSVIVANAGHGPITALYSLRSMLGWKLSYLSDEAKKEIEDMLPEWTEDTFPGYLGNVVAGRVANRFDLGGVNFTVDAACGSSLAALYVAMGELRNGNSDVVLLGAADTHNQPGDYLSFSKTHAFSQQGRCRTFDATADGIVISEGLAMVVLKRLADAERDGDRIYSVIRGIGGSSDGRDLSLTAPRPAGQMLALTRAYADAGIAPSTVTLVEAHGTGTVAGDKAEIEALRHVFEQAGTLKRACAVGSVKTMIGHTKCAAGLASLIKVTKALYHKVLPPTIGVDTPNPACQFDNSPFYINSETRPWISPASKADSQDDTAFIANSLPRRAGVSAFGFGGTNFHAVVEEYVPETAPVQSTNSCRWEAELFILKAKSRKDLHRSVEWLSDAAKKWNGAENAGKDGLRLLAYSTYLRQLERAGDGAEHAGAAKHTGEACLAMVAGSIDDLLEKLQRAKSDIADESKTEIKDPKGVYFFDCSGAANAAVMEGKLAFLFSGQGSQHVDMLKEVSLAFGEVRQTFEAADASLRGRIERPLTSYIYPPPAFTEEERKQHSAALTDTHTAQPAVGAADIAMCKLLAIFGLKPDMVAGHSYGEYVALCAADVMSERDLMRISETRGRILSEGNGDGRGAMAAFSCQIEMAQKILVQCPGVTMANVNAPNQCVVSGETKAIDKAVETAEKAGVNAKRIAVSQAFHSSHMSHAQQPLRAALNKLKLAAPKLPVYSNTDGSVYTESIKEIVERLVDHIVRPVDFVAEIRNMRSAGATTFLEVGPGAVLAGLADATLKQGAEPYLVLSTDRAGRNSLIQLLHTLAQLAAYGRAVDIERLFTGRISTHDCLSVASRGAADSSHSDNPSKKGLVYLVNSSRVERVGASASEKSKIKTAASKVGTQQTSQPTNQIKKEASVSEPVTPNSRNAMATHNSPKNGNGHNPSVNITPAAANQVAPKQSAVNVIAAKPSYPAPVQLPSMPVAQANQSGRNVDQVMMQFQQTMLQMTNNFLETQQKVMLAYLNAKTAGPAQAHNGNGNGFVHIEHQPNQAGFQQNQSMHSGAPAMGTYGLPAPTQPSFVNDFTAAPAPHSTPGNGASTFHPSENNADGNRTITYAAEQEPVPTQPTQPIDQEPVSAASDDPEKLISSLLEIVSERTGYPPDMLDPNLDLEADLGIDSIKRVEILNSFRKILPIKKQQELEGGIEELAGTKTLQGIMNWIRGDASPSQKTPTSVSASPTSTQEHNGNGSKNRRNEADILRSLESVAAGKTESVANAAISRATVSPVALAKSTAPATFIDGTWVIVGGDTAVNDRLNGSLSSIGRKSVIVSRTSKQLKALGQSADVTDESQITSLLEAIKSAHGRISGMIYVAPKTSSDPEAMSSLYTLFQLAKGLEPDLNSKSGMTLLLAAHQIGGTFGTKDRPSNPLHAGITGLVKSLNKEWPNAVCKALDFQPDADESFIVESILNEAQEVGPYVELAIEDETRLGLAVSYAPVAFSCETNGGAVLNPDSVVLVTGGARGITAEIAQELAARYLPKFVIVGRAPAPEAPESEETASLTSQRDIKAAIIEQMKREQKQVSVSAVQSIYQTLMRNREIASNLNKLKELGAQVEYHAVDVRDDKAFSKFIKSIYETHGRIDGVIHGAGIIEDAYAKDKSVQSFKRVVETKVLSALTLSKSLRLDSLKFLFFFSSVVGRTGNAGQTDYVAANEILNKLALQLNGKTSARVASLMWGPWRGGMAQQELEGIFAKYGWAMIDPLDGRRAFMEDLLHGRKEDVEVLLVAEATGQPGPSGARLHDAVTVSTAPGVSETTVTLDVGTDLYLNDHTFDGVPVMPMAMAVELMSEAAQCGNPGWRAEEIFDLDIPSGIVFESGSKTISIRTEIALRTEHDIVVSAVLGIGSPLKRANFKCKVRLIKESTPFGTSCSVPEKIERHIDPEAELRQIKAPLVAPPTVHQIYGEWFFHGPLFQGIKQVSALGADSVLGQIISSDPAKCLARTNGENWTIDPILLDSAMQLAGIWARHHLEITALPTGFRALHRVAESYSDALFVKVMVNSSEGAMELSCDLAAYNEDGSLAFVMEQLHGVGSKSLNRLAGQAASGVR